MGAEELRIQSDFGNPLRYKSRILPRRYRCETVTTSEQKVARLLAIGFEVFIDSIARRLGQFEPHGLAGFSLTHGGAIESDAVWGDILDSRATTSQPRHLLSIARLNMAKSRVRCST